MSLMATVPANVMRSPHDSPKPYFSLIGHSKFRALSKLVLSYAGERQTRKKTRFQYHKKKETTRLWLTAELTHHPSTLRVEAQAATSAASTSV